MCKKLVFLTSFVILLVVAGLSGPAHAGTVTGTHQTAIANTDWAAIAQDITALATDGDWRLWEAFGAPAYEKDTPNDLIGDLEQVGTWSAMSENWPDQNFAWSDGVSPPNTSETLVGVGSAEGFPVDAGYQVNVTLSGSGNITVWAGTRFAQGTLTILDGNVELFSIEGNDNGQFWGLDRFDLVLSGFSHGTVLTIRWIATSVAGSARCQFYGVAVVGGEPATSAYKPNPADGAIDVLRDVILGWTPGEFANTHDVYLGTNFDDVNNADIDSPLLVSPAQNDNSYNVGRLEFNRTYYWRIDEVNAPPDNTVFRGSIWSFTVEPLAIPIPAESITATANSSEPDQGPENTINSSGLDANDLHSTDTFAMWLSEAGEPGSVWIQYEFDKVYQLHEMLVWNYNGESILSLYGLKDVAVEYSTDNANWMQANIAEFVQATSTNDYVHNTTVAFDDVAAKYVRINANSTWGGDFFNKYGLSEVRFMAIPVSAREPSPADEATDVAVDATLGWRAGREAAEHKVYISTDEQAVIDGTAHAVTVTETSYSPFPFLNLGSTYSWRVDEVNNTEATPIWQGDILSFSTQESLIVDNFESYNDIPEGEEGSNLVYMTWEDGYANPATNGSTIGYITGASMETSIVYGGDQSAPLIYNNTSASSSEITVDPGKLQLGRNWSIGSPQALVLWIHGDPGNTGNDQLYVKIGNSKFPYDGDITRPQWKPMIIDLTGINLNNVSSLIIGIERSGSSGGSGVVFIDEIRLYGTTPAAPTEEMWIEAESGTVIAPMMILNDPNASGGQYIAVEDGTSSTDNPPETGGVATYTITVQGGVYKISGRVIAPGGGDDSFWFNIPGAATQTVNHASGWIQWNSIDGGADWHWDVVHSSQDNDTEVEWTMAAGTYTLEIAYREDGAQLDAIVITKID